MNDNKEENGDAHYLSIYAQFNSEAELTQWYNDNIAQHAGYGKPVFSWSMDDESIYRDKLTTAQQALDGAVKALKSIERAVPIETPDKLGLPLTQITKFTLEALAQIEELRK